MMRNLSHSNINVVIIGVIEYLLFDFYKKNLLKT